MSKKLIAITDDDNLITTLLKDYLDSIENYKVLLTASNGLDLIEKLNASDILPDILLLDLKMKEMDGVETTEYLKNNFPTIKIIIISSHYQSSFLGFMFKTGASAFVPKGISPVVLKQVIDKVYDSGVYFMEDQIESVREQISSKAPKPELGDDTDLSEREMEVLKLICMQKTAKEIGETLFITTRTVEGHRNNLFTKTGAKNIAGLVIFAIKHNVIDVNNLVL